MTKVCKKGHEYVPNEYYGRGCITCRKISLKNYHARRKNKETYLEYHAKVNKKYYDKMGASLEQRKKQRGNRLKTRYWPHLTGEQALLEYEKMLSQQNYACKICLVPNTEYKMPLHVDHDHQTLEIRGLLCPVCNKYVIGGIDIRAKAKKVTISKEQLIKNILAYYKLC